MDDRLTRVYGPETWRVYDRLDRSLEPRGPDSMVARAGEYLAPGAVVLDAGCRDAAYLVHLAQAYGVTGYGIDPVPLHVERAREAVATAGLTGRVEIAQASMTAHGRPDGSIDLVWCRDVLEQVAPLVPSLRAVARTLRPSGRMLVHTVVTTERLEPGEAALLARHLGNVHANLAEPALRRAFAAAGLVVEERDAIGTEWREYAEERTQPVSRALLRLARLRRQRDAVVAEHGLDVYRHVEANLHWEAYQFLGKLEPVGYVLRRADAP